MSASTSVSRKYFGTDGIRGRVGQHPITPDFWLRLGWATGRVFASKGRAHVVIGKDTRISGYMLESVLESGLAAAGANVSLLGPMPTPAVAYLTRTLRADAGIVISASHNPYYDNGIKFFDGDGNKLPDSVELEIEAELDKTMSCVESDQLGKAQRLPDARGRYIEFCKATVSRGFSLRGLRVAIDCANGATYHVAPRVFEELGADVIPVGVSPDGVNINDQCGSTYPAALIETVREYRADLGIAFDGDGDRVIMVDHNGETIDGDDLIYIIARHRQAAGSLQGGVVGTVMTNFGLEKQLQAHNIPFCRANVGDRYVLEQLRSRDWQIGGEASGHVLCLDLTTTGDAIVAALQVLVAVVETGSSLAELCSGVEKMPQTMINVKVADPSSVADNAAVREAVTDVETQLAGRGRVLIRASGTEPVVRVMVEGEDGAEVADFARQLAHVVETDAAGGPVDALAARR
ncbi:MAG: phosphoglucosamine mutase [Pseudomonadaceae bacterium]|nr:phosphoglucosamine mutase [Pseudomonadaceae bacterium]